MLNNLLTPQWFYNLVKYSASTLFGLALASTLPSAAAKAITTSQTTANPSTRVEVAQSITPADDGTGTVVNQTDNNFDITGGTQTGNNLFHSFEQLGLDASETANILSSPDINNILSRVVGGNASVIDGLLQVTGSNANLFLINPAGIIFGPDAQVLVPGAFTATTADAIQLDEAWFNALGDNDYATMFGDPSGFAFNSSEPGAVINAGNIASPGERITLLGGVVVNTGSIKTPGGIINIAAVPGENSVEISPEGSLLTLALPTESPSGLNASSQSFTASDLPALLSGEAVGNTLGVVVDGGVITLVATDTEIPTEAGTAIASGTLDASDVSANGGGGDIDVLGDRVGILDGTLNTSGTNGGGNIRIGGGFQGNGPVANAERTYISEGSTIAADGTENGDGGRVIAWADGLTAFAGEISAQGGLESGDGGFVEVSGAASLSFNGDVNTTAPNGETGQLLLDPEDVEICNSSTCPTITSSEDALSDREILATDQPGTTFFISPQQVVNALANGDVTIAADNTIIVRDNIEVSENNNNDFTLDASGVDISGELTVGRGNLSFVGSNYVSIDESIKTNGGNVSIETPFTQLAGDISITTVTPFDDRSPGGDILIDSYVFVYGSSSLGGTSLTGNDIEISGEIDGFVSSSILSLASNRTEGNILVNGNIGDFGSLGSFDISSANEVNLKNVDVGFFSVNNINSIEIASPDNLLFDLNSFLFSNVEEMSFSAVDDVRMIMPPGDSASINLLENITISSVVGDIQLSNIDINDIGNKIDLDAGNSITIENAQLTVEGQIDINAGRNVNIFSSKLAAHDSLEVSALGSLYISDTTNLDDETVFRSRELMRLQGNQGINIDALNRVESAFISGDNLELVSDQQIIGNGRFIAEGDIRLLTTEEEAGSFTYNPVSSLGIISADGNVSFGTYEGPALKIEATGSIDGENITINAANPRLTGSDADIRLLGTSSSLILRAGVAPYQLGSASSRLPNLDEARNQSNLTTTPSSSTTIEGTTIEVNEITGSPATINVGNIDTSAAEGSVILNAPGDIITGFIDTKLDSTNTNNEEFGEYFSESGAISIQSGGLVSVGTTIPSEPSISVSTSEQPINIQAHDDLTIVGALDTNAFSGETPSSVRLLSDAGDIEVGFIDTGADGIDITAAGSFRATDSFTTSFDVAINEADPDSPFTPLNPPSELVDFVTEITGAEREAVLESVEDEERDISTRFRRQVSLFVRPSISESIIPITVRVGDQARVIPPISLNSEGVESVISIFADSSQPFVIGPSIDSNSPPFIPLDSGDDISDFSLETPFTLTTNPGIGLTFPSEDFPEIASGISGGIGIGSGSNSSLYGTLQSQTFGGDVTGGGGNGSGARDGRYEEPDGGFVHDNEDTLIVQSTVCEEDAASEDSNELLIVDETLLPEGIGSSIVSQSADACAQEVGSEE